VINLIRTLVRLEWPFRILSPVFGRYHPFHPAFRDNPYPTYRRLQQETPIYFHSLLRVWILSRYSDILDVLRDPRFTVSRSHESLQKVAYAKEARRKMNDRLVEFMHALLVTLDPPAHTRVRKLAQTAFTSSHIERLHSRIEAIAGETADRLLAGDEIELMHDFAIPFPLRVITEMLGVPRDDIALVEGWTRRVGTMLDPIAGEATLAEVNQAFGEMDSYFRTLFQSRRRHPGDDMISTLLAAQDAGDRLSEIELFSLVGFLLEAGHVTTAGFIGNSAAALLSNPAACGRLLEDQSLLETAVDEFLRYDPPVQATVRIASDDIEFRGTRMKKGEQVLCLIAAANRDGEVFTDPENLDVGRRNNPHIAFGYGTHYCLGAQLARVEARVALQVLLQLLPRIRGDAYELSWKTSIFLRSPKELRFRV
jgi:cytochrome P450